MIVLVRDGRRREIFLLARRTFASFGFFGSARERVGGDVADQQIAGAQTGFQRTKRGRGIDRDLEIGSRRRHSHELLRVTKTGGQQRRGGRGSGLLVEGFRRVADPRGCGTSGFGNRARSGELSQLGSSKSLAADAHRGKAERLKIFFGNSLGADRGRWSERGEGRMRRGEIPAQARADQ